MQRCARRFTGIMLAVPLALGSASSSSAAAEPADARPAADSVKHPLSLDEAIRTGLARSSALAAARSEAEIAGAETHEFEAARWPRLSLGGAWRRTNNPVLVFGDKLTAGEFTAADFALDSLNHPDSQSHAVADAGLELPLDLSGRMRSDIAASRAAASGAQARLGAAASDLVANIVLAYHGVTASGRAVEAAEASLGESRRHEELANARYEQGAALRTDPLRARIRRLARERDLETRRADAELARRRLDRLLELPPGETAEPTETLEPPEGPLGGIDPWVSRAREKRPELVAASKGEESAQAGVRGARAAFVPDVSAQASYERNASGFDSGEGSYLMGVALRWTVFDVSRKPRVVRAEARERAASAGRRALEDAVGIEVESAYRDARVGDESLRIAREIVASAEDARRIAEERYAGGLLPLGELLDVETELADARQGEIAALYGAVAARTRLSRAAGDLEASRWVTEP